MMISTKINLTDTRMRAVVLYEPAKPQVVQWANIVQPHTLVARLLATMINDRPQRAVAEAAHFKRFFWAFDRLLTR